METSASPRPRNNVVEPVRAAQPTNSRVERHPEEPSDHPNDVIHIQTPVLAVTRPLSIYYQNVRGLRTKTNDLHLVLSSCDYDIIVFTETWLRDDISNAELTSNYVLHRCDRNSLTSNLTRGGGVLIGVHRSLQCSIIEVPDAVELEQVAVKVSLENMSIYVCCVYLRPNSDPELYRKHSKTVQYLLDRTNETDMLIVLGDYNLPNLSWDFDEHLNAYLPANASSESEITLTQTILDSGLSQICCLPNANGRLLDLSFVSDTQQIQMVEPPTALLKVDAHHRPFVLTCDVSSFPAEEQNDAFYYDFKRFDPATLDAALATVDWTSILSDCPVNIAVSRFYEIVRALIAEMVPLKKIPQAHHKYPWWSRELGKHRNKLRKIRKRFFKNRSAENMLTLQNAENAYNELKTVAFQNYINRLETDFKNDPSSFWTFVKSRKQNHGAPSDMFYDDRQANDNCGSANLFADFFSSVYNDELPAAENVTNSSNSIHLPRLEVSANDVLTALSAVDPSKGAGPDRLPPILFKQCAASLSLPVSILFNKSLSNGVFPDAWKIASISPIHKNGNIHNVANYRPISILNCLGKVLEKIVHDALYRSIRHVISVRQHGFMKNRSTTTNLMTFVHGLIGNLEKRKQIDTVYIDFSKAFDKVPHSLAVDKMRCIGLPDWIIEWTLSYLTNREGFVKFNGAVSNSFNIPSGVPQGSHLGPLIFIIFVNDICSLLHCDCLMYADDLKIYRTVSSSLDCFALQEDLNRLLAWCNLNRMQVNSTKCKVISFTRQLSPIDFAYTMGPDNLERVAKIRDLGVLIDSKGKFNDHISTVTAKAHALLGFIRRNTAAFNDVYALKTLFCAIVRSTLEYAVQVWAPYHREQVTRIESVQRSFLRYALRRLPWTNPTELPAYEDRCRLINLETLAMRRTRLRRLFIFDLITNRIDCSYLLQNVHFHAPVRHLRNRILLWVPIHRTRYAYFEPLVACCRVFNDVTEKFDFNITKETFSVRIRNLE